MIIHITEFEKNKSKKLFCVGCKEEVYPIFATKIQSHFRHKKHELVCEYEKLFFYNKNRFYDDEFHKKWTFHLIKNEYLYRYWYNQNIADIYKDHITIIVRDKVIEKREILKFEQRDHEKDKTIFLLNYEKRPIDIYKFKSMYFLYSKNGNYYDIPFYDKKKIEIYIDFKSSYIFKLKGNYFPIFGYHIDIEDIDKFIKNKLNGMCKNTFQKGNEEIVVKEYEDKEDLEIISKEIDKNIDFFIKIVNHISNLEDKMNHDIDTDRIMCYKYHFKNKNGEVFFEKNFLINISLDEIYHVKITHFIFKKMIEWIINEKKQKVMDYEKVNTQIYMKNDENILKMNDFYSFKINKMVFGRYKEKLIDYFDEILHKNIHKIMI